MPKTSYSSQLESLIIKAQNDINRCVKKIGEKSEFSDNQVIPIPFKIEFYLMTSGMIREVGDNVLIDEQRNEYDNSIMPINEFLQLADYIVNI